MASTTAEINKDAKFPCFVCGKSIRGKGVWVRIKRKYVEVCPCCVEKYDLHVVPI